MIKVNIVLIVFKNKIVYIWIKIKYKTSILKNKKQYN